ncbi:MAG: NAD(P)H-binding protein [Bacteroidota bacterium]
MKIAVTAANGGLGSATVGALLKEMDDHHIIGLARTPKKAAHLGIEINPGDYNNKKDLYRSLSGTDKLLFISSNDKPVNRSQQHSNVIEAAKKGGVKHILYTSIVGDPEKTGFHDIVASNRKTEDIIKESGMNFTICRNGIYADPDLEYLEEYKKAGYIDNSAGKGRCAYTSRSELAYAYTRVLLTNNHFGKTYNMVGEPITQHELVDVINRVYGTNLDYKEMSVEAYTKQRVETLGEFYGTLVGGIYESIRLGIFDVPSDYQKAAGRAHKSPEEMIRDYKNNKPEGYRN